MCGINNILIIRQISHFAILVSFDESENTTNFYIILVFHDEGLPSGSFVGKTAERKVTSACLCRSDADVTGCCLFRLFVVCLGRSGDAFAISCSRKRRFAVGLSAVVRRVCKWCRRQWSFGRDSDRFSSVSKKNNFYKKPNGVSA